MIFGGLIGYATSEDGSAARAEIGALQSRNTNLMMMMQRNGCWSGGNRPAAAPAPAAPAPMAAPATVPAAGMPALDPDAIVLCRLSGGTVQQMSRGYCVNMGGQPVG